MPKIKRIGDYDTNNKNIQPGYRNGISHRKICHTYKETWGKRNNGTYRTTKRGKYQKSWRKWKLEVLRNIGSWHQKKKKEIKGVLHMYTCVYICKPHSVYICKPHNVNTYTIEGGLFCFGCERFINFWLRFFDTRRETQFLKVFRNHTMLTTPLTVGTSGGVLDLNSSSLVGIRKT